MKKNRLVTRKSLQSNKDELQRRILSYSASSGDCFFNLFIFDEESIDRLRFIVNENALHTVTGGLIDKILNLNDNDLDYDTDLEDFLIMGTRTSPEVIKWGIDRAIQKVKHK